MGKTGRSRVEVVEVDFGTGLAILAALAI